MKVLFVTQSFSAQLSGGMVMRRMAEALAARGDAVHVFCTGGAGGRPADNQHPTIPSETVEFSGRFNTRQLLPGEQARRLEARLRAFRPEVVHLAALNYSQSRFFGQVAKQAGARLVASVWTHDYFCAQGYGLRAGRECRLCFEGGLHHSALQGCVAPRRAPLHLANRALIARDLRLYDAFLSTLGYTDDALAGLGVERSRLVRAPLAFDPARLEGLAPSDGQRWAWYGQAQPWKGTDVLWRAATELRSVQFGLYPWGDEASVDRTTAGLGPLAPRVLIDSSLRWGSGLAQAVAGARGVLLPTLWPTTTEYALLEALGLGKPVVAFGVGVHRELLVDGENALVAPEGDTVGYLERVRAADADPDLRARLGARAREFLADYASVPRLLAALDRAYAPAG